MGVNTGIDVPDTIAQGLNLKAEDGRVAVCVHRHGPAATPSATLLLERTAGESSIHDAAILFSAISRSTKIRIKAAAPR